MDNSMKFFITLLGVMATSSSLPFDSCPDDFVTLDARCIFIATDVYEETASPRTWEEAKGNCSQLAPNWTTKLASLDANFLEAFTKYIVESIPGMKKYTFWSGAELVNGQWQWSDGTPISNTSYVWEIDYPVYKHDIAFGLLVPSGAFNRYYLIEYTHTLSPSFICEAKHQ